MLAVPAGGRAQWISPGPLADAHTSLEGLRNCVQCHRLGRKGVDDDRCLACHGPLESRVRAGRGYHARIQDQGCAGCHKDHFGRDFALVRMDSASFDHNDAGYRLEGTHADVSCGTCHSADRIIAADVIAWGRENDVLGSTLLGLGTTCLSCHSVDDPHGTQFTGRECDVCHATVAWDRAERFDHDRTAYGLTGAHRSVSCDGCHPAAEVAEERIVRYTGVRSGNCSACHEDTHLGTMGADCASCHDARGWAAVNRTAVADRFDHAVTNYPLRGEHASASCEACHARPRRGGDVVRIQVVAGTERAAYPLPHAGSCADCHVDAHSVEFAERPDQGACESCHTEFGWAPASFGIDRHNQETDYPLTGAHLVAFCTGCHEETPGEGGLRFAVAEQNCVSCHRDDDPHEASFGDVPCEDCHVTESFAVVTFDHAPVGSLTCASCHSPDDPHAGQFERTDCGACHGTDSYQTPAFDHTETRFPLEGGHLQVACAECHASETDAEGVTIVRYVPLRIECAACHGSPS